MIRWSVFSKNVLSRSWIDSTFKWGKEGAFFIQGTLAKMGAG
jgi:hypothetical protein